MIEQKTIKTNLKKEQWERVISTYTLCEHAMVKMQKYCIKTVNEEYIISWWQLLSRILCFQTTLCTCCLISHRLSLFEEQQAHTGCTLRHAWLCSDGLVHIYYHARNDLLPDIETEVWKLEQLWTDEIMRIKSVKNLLSWKADGKCCFDIERGSHYKSHSRDILLKCVATSAFWYNGNPFLCKNWYENGSCI